MKSELDEFKFNWTMSYRFDSEVSDCSYGCSYSIENSTQHELRDFHIIANHDYKNRQNSAIWFVSNCDSKYRIDFASKLKSHFPIEVVGSCAKYVHSKEESFFINFIRNLFQPSCDRYSACESKKLAKPKFYLSFESKNCSNYLTEKIWRILRSGLIPVVLQPNKEFYELNLPPDSFIHAQDFDYDPVRLANYLDRVSKNFSLL